MVARQEVLNQTPYNDQSWIGMTALSVVCHILFFSGVIFLPELTPTSPYLFSVVEVDLVSLPQGKPQAQPPSVQVPVSSPAEVEPARSQPADRARQAEPELPAKEPKVLKPREADVKAVSLAPKPLQVKRSLKKKTFNVSKVITSAIERIEKRAPESRPRPVLHAIDKLKKEVDEAAGTVMRGDATARAAMSKKDVDLLDIYNAEIWHRIQKNWAFSEHMARDRKDLAAVIIVKIMRDGEIRDIWFEKKSGHSYFDESVFKAVKKSDPLPPLPEGFLRPYYDVGFRFNLSELKRSS
jgi:colicin import membrane protein